MPEICRKTPVPPLAHPFPSLGNGGDFLKTRFQWEVRRADIVRKEGTRLAERQEVPRVRLFLTLFSPKIPPVKVVARGWGASTEDPPAPLVHQVAEGQEGDFL